MFKLNAKKVVAEALVAVLVLAAVPLTSCAKTKELVINSGEDIVIDAGESIDIPVSGEGLEEDNCEVTFTSDALESLLKFDGNTLTAAYDRDQFISSGELDDTQREQPDEREADEDSEYTTFTNPVHGTVTQGDTTWEGDVNVVVRLKKVDFDNGEYLKGESLEKGSSVEVTTGLYAAYMCFESDESDSKDVVFLLKPHETTVIDMPKGSYHMYYAEGEYWYGEDYLFGTFTEITRDKEGYDFSLNKYFLNLVEGSGEGDNAMDSEDVDPEELVDPDANDNDSLEEKQA